jgi:hypothetical protein
MSRLKSRLREEGSVNSSGFTLLQLAILQHILDAGPTTAASLAATEHVSQQVAPASGATPR